MTKIATRRHVGAPLGSAGRLLDAYLADHPGPAGASRIILRGAGLEVASTVMLTRAHRPQDMEPRFEVRWQAETAGPYPVFDGILAIGAAEDYNSFSLDLNGAYEPPLGIAGKAFDAVVGRRIAEGTVNALLIEIQTSIELRFDAEEAAKPH